MAGTGLSGQRTDIATPGYWLRLSGRAFARSWGRDVMLYTGGVSFFALLAVEVWLGHGLLVWP